MEWAWNSLVNSHQHGMLNQNHFISGAVLIRGPHRAGRAVRRRTRKEGSFSSSATHDISFPPCPCALGHLDPLSRVLVWPRTSCCTRAIHVPFPRNTAPLLWLCPHPQTRLRLWLLRISALITPTQWFSASVLPFRGHSTVSEPFWLSQIDPSNR